jgi:hypothetical protein
MWWLLFIRNAHVIYILYNIDAAKVASSMVERGDNWQLEGSDVMGLTRGLISCCQSFAPMADIAVALVVFTYGKIDLNIRTVIIPRPISTLGLKPSGR